MNAARVRASGAVAPVRPPTVVRSPGAPSRAPPRVCRRRRGAGGGPWVALLRTDGWSVWGGGSVPCVACSKSTSLFTGLISDGTQGGAITCQLRVAQAVFAFWSGGDNARTRLYFCQRRGQTRKRRARNGTKSLHLQVPFSPNAGCAHSIVNFRQTRHLTLRSSRRVQGDESTTGVPYCCAQQAGRNSTARVERAQRSRHTCNELRLWAERLVAIVVLLSGGALHIRAIRAGDLNSPQLACGRRCTRRVSVG